MSAPLFADPDTRAIPLRPVWSDDLEAWLADQDEPARDWVEATGFRAKAGELCRIPGPDLTVSRVLLGMGRRTTRRRTRFAVARAARALSEGTYRLDGEMTVNDTEEAALGWLLSGYRFTRYRPGDGGSHPGLIAPRGVDASRLETIAEGEFLTRDLINTPAQDMGPDELEHAAHDLARRHQATCTVTTGDDLLNSDLPLIHAVGRASTRAPRLIDLTWGAEDAPKLTLVGKGVCFDTGGLNLKPASSMGLMKKDMGGAATVLGLAYMVMASGLDLRLRVLIPAVENAVAGNAFRPGDVLTSRSGKTVEINNTDAEGRLVLADALTVATEDEDARPDLLVCMATLTGAARVALGPDLAPFYTDDDALAMALAHAAARVRDPVWRMPFHRPYETMIEPGIADLDNAPSGGFAGSVTAALFLDRFVPDAVRFAHFDIYGWNPTAAPARPKGGVGQGARALFEALPKVLAR
ncbi:leucyl aminopeptidase family protein [Jannaschia aquimarina]|uniref:PepB protein n=1 Tax=Jannaschia aquimarina TaxID=935700 RepID=A0A0D1CQD3_9RHOB|nr:leucyl aminopeptidase family protein [Jannaschia aquimarina]KIT16992.1 Peptidase B [Jannaschia aquimarina]SNS81004.1 leucyl aminopeptidase [Jannaschia aquimarina]